MSRAEYAVDVQNQFNQINETFKKLISPIQAALELDRLNNIRNDALEEDQKLTDALTDDELKTAEIDLIQEKIRLLQTLSAENAARITEITQEIEQKDYTLTQVQEALAEIENDIANAPEDTDL